LEKELEHKRLEGRRGPGLTRWGGIGYLDACGGSRGCGKKRPRGLSEGWRGEGRRYQYVERFRNVSMKRQGDWKFEAMRKRLRSKTRRCLKLKEGRGSAYVPYGEGLRIEEVCGESALIVGAVESRHLKSTSARGKGYGLV